MLFIEYIYIYILHWNELMLKNSYIAQHTQGGVKSHLRKLIRERGALGWHLEWIIKQFKAQEAWAQSVGLPCTAEVTEKWTEIKSLAEVSEKLEKLIAFAKTSIRENNRPVESSE